MKKLVIVLAIVLAASNAWAFRGANGCCAMPPDVGMNPSVASDLNLTEDQKAQIQSRREAFMEEIAPLRSDLFAKREELRQLWAAANPDQGKITAMQQEMREIQGQIQEKTTQYRLDCHQVLTSEQQETLGTLKVFNGRWAGVRGSGMGNR
jgi:Spy/CpxP family protein refolding chaperone